MLVRSNLWLHMYVYIYVRMYVRMYVCMYVYMHVCMYVRNGFTVVYAPHCHVHFCGKDNEKLGRFNLVFGRETMQDNKRLVC